jgi:DNA-binding MarR family transcriptional regulator
MTASLRPESSPGYLVNHLGRLLAQALRDRIAPYGVVPGQFAQLLVLYESDGLTQAELCARVQIEQPTMAKTLARMERDGLITRTPDPLDQRRSRVWLTAHARRLEPDLVAAAQAVNAVATQGLTGSQIAAFRTVLGAAIANLEAARAPGGPLARTEETTRETVR